MYNCGLLSASQNKEKSLSFLSLVFINPIVIVIILHLLALTELSDCVLFYISIHQSGTRPTRRWVVATHCKEKTIIYLTGSTELIN